MAMSRSAIWIATPINIGIKRLPVHISCGWYCSMCCQRDFAVHAIMVFYILTARCRLNYCNKYDVNSICPRNISVNTWPGAVYGPVCTVLWEGTTLSSFLSRLAHSIIDASYLPRLTASFFSLLE